MIYLLLGRSLNASFVRKQARGIAVRALQQELLLACPYSGLIHLLGQLCLEHSSLKCPLVLSSASHKISPQSHIRHEKNIRCLVGPDVPHLSHIYQVSGQMSLHQRGLH